MSIEIRSGGVISKLHLTMSFKSIVIFYCYLVGARQPWLYILKMEVKRFLK